MMDELKQIVAENIIRLRASLNMTQAQLGEYLNYSDKSVSKWERGESLPDVYVLRAIAQLAGVTVDYIITPHTQEEEVTPHKRVHRYSRSFITLTVLAGIWTLAVLVFVVLWLSGVFSWLVFVYAVPVSLITLLVLNSVWGDRSWNLYIVSGIVWGIICSVYLSALSMNWWQLFLLGIPAQIIIIFAFSIKLRPKKEKGQKTP